MEKRILLDTNVYGILLEDKPFFDLFTSLVHSSFIIYGSALIRKELRDISSQAEFHGKKKRVLLLTIYDSFKEYVKRFQLRWVLKRIKRFNAFMNSGSFLASSTSLMNAFTVFHLYCVLVLSVMPIITQPLYLNFTPKNAQIPNPTHNKGFVHFLFIKNETPQ